jgi:signal transduction histidine kinase
MKELGNNIRYKKVLVIDDTDLDRLLADKIIRKYDFADEVVLMESADEMLDYLNQFQCPSEESHELIFLDINMPEMDGWEFLERFDLLDEKIKDNFKILIVSSSTDSKDRKRAFENRYVVDYITKPLSKDIILRLHAELEQKVYQRTQVLAEALKKEQELSQLKSRFVSIASHEFRTPLSVILSSANLLSKYSSVDDLLKREEHIERIKSSVHILTDILNDFLSVNKIEDGKIYAKYSDLDIEILTNKIIEEFHTLNSKGKIHYSHTGLTTVTLDSSLYRFILFNLLSNASKYSHENSEIHVETIVTDKEFILKVNDSGIGISKEDIDHLFDLFFRGNNALHIQGTGIGLHIVAKYTELMNGTINCQSEINVGTQFTISIPTTKS